MFSTRYRVSVTFDAGMYRLDPDVLRRKTRERRRALMRLEPWQTDCDVESPMPSEEALAPQRALQRELARDPDALDRWFRAEIVESLWDGFSDNPLDGWEIFRRLAPALPAASRDRVLQALDDDFSEGIPFLDEFWCSIEVRLTGLRLGPGQPWGPDRVDPDDVAASTLRALVDGEVTMHPVTLERALSRNADWMARYEPSFLSSVPGLGPNLPDADELKILRELQAALLRSPECLDLALKSSVMDEVVYGGLDGMGEHPSAEELLLQMVDRIPAFHRPRLRAAAARGEVWSAMEHLWFTLHTELRSLEIWKRP